MPADSVAPAAAARRPPRRVPARPELARHVRRALRRRDNPPTVGPLERALALRTVPMFHQLRPRQLAALAQHMRECDVRRGTVLQAAGESVRMAYLLTDGRVRQQGEGGAPAMREAPEALGLVALLAGQPARTTAIADTDVSALVIDEAALLDVLEEHFSVVLHVHAMLAGEIAALQSQLGCYEPPPADATAEPPPISDGFDLVKCLLWLQRAPDLRRLGVAVLAALLRDHRQLRFAAGEELFAAGAQTSGFIVLARGDVSCNPATAEGCFRAAPGDVLGRDAALAGLPHPYGATADTPVAALAVDAQVFWDVAEDHFHVARAALAMSAAHLLWLQHRAEDALEATRPAPVSRPDREDPCNG